MSTQKKFKVIGIMSGTSMDGLDCSFIETDGEKYFSIIYEKTYYYSKNYKLKLNKIISLYNSNKRKLNKSRNQKFVTETFIHLINKFINQYKINKETIDFIGLSGQTIYHNPKKKKSIQYGSCRDIQKKFKINVIGDFRKNDIKNGGQGAPIGAFYHKYIIEKFAKDSAIINIGGISNISYVKNKNLYAFDIGPGNALIDDLMYFFYKKKFDYNGATASKGKANKKLIDEVLNDDFYSLNYPKSLDRQYFNKYFNKLTSINSKDSIHTGSMITILSITNCIKSINKKFKKIILTGGGRKNLFVYNSLKRILSREKIQLSIIDKYGLNGDMIESQMFGYLAVRSHKKLPLSIPTTTGVKKPMSGGILYK